MKDVASIILGGGQGKRLFPLTVTRCKPAIPFGGRYRLIDVPVSNSLNSNIRKIFVITQFLSSSLHRHLLRTYHFDAYSSGFIQLLTAEQRPSGTRWFGGTADAVRENAEYFLETAADYFLILSGDQLYNINFQKILAFAKETDADLTIATTPVSAADAHRMGILSIDEEANVIKFHEKPKDEKVLAPFRTNPSLFKKMGLPSLKGRDYLASMGIYVFKRDALFRLLREDPREDFGKHLIPTKIKQGKVSAFLYGGYWEDIGTIDSFYRANLALTSSSSGFNCYDETNMMYTYHHNLPGPKIFSTKISNSIICEGALIEAKTVSNSILGPRTAVKKGTHIKESILMGNDFYYPPNHSSNRLPGDLHIGENCLIQKAIIDKNVQIGNDVQLINKNNLTEYDGKNIYIRDGIIVIMRGAHLPDGFIL